MRCLPEASEQHNYRVRAERRLVVPFDGCATKSMKASNAAFSSGARVPPESTKAQRTALTPGHAEEVLQTVFMQRIAFHVEVEISVRGRRQAVEAPARLCGAKLVARCAGTFPQHLQTGLRVESRERGGRHARHCLWPRMCRQRGHRRHATVGQPAHLQTRDAGNLPEVVVPHALCFAQIRPAAIRPAALLALRAGIRIRVRGGLATQALRRARSQL